MNQTKLLVIDDQLDNFDVVEALLASENYQLFYASSGTKAFSLLESMSPDLILLDVMMPEMDGLQICSRLKADLQYQHIPIIMVTALTSKADLARCLEQGADDFISKPLDSLELRARVRSLLRIKQQHDKLKDLLALREEALTLREDMSNMIIHDLRNPLSTIILAAGIIKRNINQTDKTETILHKIEQILDASQRLQKMIDSLLFMAKLEAGKILFNPIKTDLYQLGVTIMADFELIAIAHHIKLYSELPPQGQTISVDATILRRIIDNLISNALKFAPANSQVLLSLECLPEDRVRVRVTDTGLGIDENRRKQIFEKFEIGTLKNNISQIGLGLAFCKMAVEAQGGSLKISDNFPQGSIFTVEI
jgi:signal transduction histidine kinase